MLISILLETSLEFNMYKETHQCRPGMQTIWVERVCICSEPLPNWFLTRLERKRQQLQEQLEQAAATNNEDDILFRVLSSGIVRSRSSSARRSKEPRSRSISRSRLSSIASEES